MDVKESCACSAKARGFGVAELVAVVDDEEPTG